MAIKSEHFKIGFAVAALLGSAILAILFFTLPRHQAPNSLIYLQKKVISILEAAPPVEPIDSSITIQFFGDIMLDRNVAKAMGAEGLNYIFAKANGQIFDEADMRIANLEGPFAPARVPTTKSIAFRFDPKLAPQLKAYGFTAFSLANNHNYDMGRANVAATRDTLAENDLGYFGDELNEGSQYTWIAATNTTNLTPLLDQVAFIGLHNTYHNLDLKKMEEALLDARKRARYVIVNVHWGEEYQRISNKKQSDLARWLIDHGADAVIGHHPHVVQEMEIYKDKPIFYSLGNFIFDQYFSLETQEGLSVSLTLDEGKVESVKLLPFYGEKSQVQLMDSERRENFFDWLQKSSRLEGREIGGGVIKF